MSISTVCRLLVGLVSIYFTLPAFSQSVLPDSIQFDTTFRRIAEDERKRLIDPATGTVPYERLEEARRQLTERQSQTNASIPNVTWQERGPSNAGGRTYTLLFDPSDPARKKVWAGNLLGGLWYTSDITDNNAVWTPVSEAWENRTVTALAADPSNPQIMYAGTGDRSNSLSGGGIWKTSNGGTTWTRLSNTIPSGNAPTVRRALEFIQRIVVNSNGQVFVATQYGVVKSTDGGNSWSYALAPGQLIGIGGNTSNYYYDNVTDLEIGTDGILYAAFNPSRVFKSSDTSGNTWQEITPPGATGSERTELALAPSTSGTLQVIYAVSRAYNPANYYQDVRWFKKSTNGGATWSDVVIPTLSSTSSGHFTWGNGYYSLSLAVHPTDPNTVYAGGYTWCRSTNGGASWSTPPIVYGFNHGLYFQPGSNTNVAFASTDGVR